MMEAPSFPRSESELDAWHVYADALIERGSPRGALLAYELSLPSQPSAAEYARFRQSKQNLDGIHRALGNEVELAWCLGHVRTLHVGYGANPAAIAQALTHPTMQRLEEIELLPQITDLSAAPWLALLRALPSTCRRIAVTGTSMITEAASFTMALSAAGLTSGRTVAITGGRAENFVFDKWPEVDARNDFDDPLAFDRLLRQLATTKSVRVRVARMFGPPNVHERVLLGRVGDPAFVCGERIVTLPRPSLVAQQQEHGLVPIRALLGRTLPERQFLTPLISPEEWGPRLRDVVLERAGDGQMRVRSGEDNDQILVVDLDGVPLLRNEWRAITQGARLTVGGVDWRFVDDVARFGRRT